MARVTASRVDPQLRSEIEDASDPNRAWLGVEFEAQSGGAPGVRVSHVMRGSPAAEAELRPGDVILTVDGENMSSPGDVRRKIAELAPHHRVAVGFERASATRLASVELARLPTDEGILRLTYVGVQAPMLERLRAAHGSAEPNLQALGGRVVLLEFSAPWCVACAVMSPTLNRWVDRYQAQGFQVVGVMAERVGTVARAARQLGMEYPVFSDETGIATRTYRAFAVPTLFLIDQRGVVRDVMVGYSRERLQDLGARLERLLSAR